MSESESTYWQSAMTELGLHEIVPRKSDLVEKEQRHRDHLGYCYFIFKQFLRCIYFILHA